MKEKVFRPSAKLFSRDSQKLPWEVHLRSLTTEQMSEVLAEVLSMAPVDWIPQHLFDFIVRPQGRSFKDIMEMLPITSQEVLKCLLSSVDTLADIASREMSIRNEANNTMSPRTHARQTLIKRFLVVDAFGQALLGPEVRALARAIPALQALGDEHPGEFLDPVIEHALAEGLLPGLAERAQHRRDVRPDRLALQPGRPVRPGVGQFPGQFLDELLIGGSGSTPAGDACQGTFTLHGHQYAEAIPGLAQYETGEKVHIVVVPGDPALLAPTHDLANEHSSWTTFILPVVLFVAFLLLLLGWVVLRAPAPPRGIPDVRGDPPRASAVACRAHSYCALPAGLRGMSATKTTRLGTLYPASRSRTVALSASSVALQPERNATIAVTA